MKKEKNTDWIYYVFVFLSAIAVFTYILHVGFISSGSMEPALMTHDVTVSSRIIISPIKCGDIISFKRENGDIYGKRVIGVAGDEVMIIGGHVYINGEMLDENYGLEVMDDPGIAAEPITLGEDEYFVLGDNRNHSSDSRDPSVGVLHRDDIMGRAWIRIWPFDKFGVIKHE